MRRHGRTRSACTEHLFELGPVSARPISTRLPDDFRRFIGNTISVAGSTSIIVALVGCCRAH